MPVAVAAPDRSRAACAAGPRGLAVPAADAGRARRGRRLAAAPHHLFRLHRRLADRPRRAASGSASTTTCRWRTLPSGRTIYRGLLVDPAWWRAVWNTVRFAVDLGDLETILGLIVALVLNAEFRAAASCAPPSSSPGRSRPSSRPRCGRGCSTTSSASSTTSCSSLGLIRPEDRLDRQRRHGDDRGAGRRHLEDDAVHGAAHPRRPADGARATSTRRPRSTASTRSRCSGKVTLPLIRPALMVAVIFRALDALRIFDLIYVLTPNNAPTKIDVGARPREPVRLRQVRLRLGRRRRCCS